jgi:protein-S-isoprenylcysteine O-methyltransferase Ste14
LLKVLVSRGRTRRKDLPFVISPRLIRKARPVGLRIAATLTVVALLYTEPLWAEHTATHLAMETLGGLLLAVGVLGRLWCTFYIAGKKSRQLVTDGPYALCRNPLYLFSFLLGAGMTLIFQNAAVFVFFSVFFLAFHLMAISREERNLTGIFGVAYLNYCQQVPRVIPTLSNWRTVLDRQGLAVSWRHLARTMADSSAYLLALPLAELLEIWHRNGSLPLG